MNYVRVFVIGTFLSSSVAAQRRPSSTVQDFLRQLVSSLHPDFQPYPQHFHQNEQFLEYPGPERPVVPAYPPGYVRPPNSLAEALASIARYDDLKCVPRLLCEVSSGTRSLRERPKDKSPEFAPSDAFVAFLTSMNFLDESPIVMFARAALLGYSIRGDGKGCFAAYPKCPTNPNELVDYLNNHNGGFFRFFNQQLHQMSQYAPLYNKKYKDFNPNARILNVRKEAPKKLKFFYGTRMIFPDRTGTGNLISTYDPAFGDTKISYASESGKIKFLDGNSIRPGKFVFPE